MSSAKLKTQFTSNHIQAVLLIQKMPSVNAFHLPVREHIGVEQLPLHLRRVSPPPFTARHES